ncbi:hypothetical protein [Paraburkholderia aspalathi]|uniref:hypothetical protein n=1 Tax=Paraburkholderia aspalathi TaxID=1324617 RepID=UPI0038BD747F
MKHLTDEEITAVAALLSGERLGTFQAMAGSTRAAVALHQEMLQLAGALMSVTAVVEIALRKLLQPEHAALENQAHALQIRLDAFVRANHPCAKHGHMHSRAFRTPLREHRRTCADATHSLKPRSPDPPRS